MLPLSFHADAASSENPILALVMNYTQPLLQVIGVSVCLCPVCKAGREVSLPRGVPLLGFFVPYLC